MINKIPMLKTPTSADLRRTFESAVEVIRKPESAAARPRYGVPIVQRRRTAALPQPSEEKRALTDAAKALAMLWKVPAISR